MEQIISSNCLVYCFCEWDRLNSKVRPTQVQNTEIVATLLYIYLHTKHEAWESPLKNATTWYKYYVPPIFHQVKTDEEDPIDYIDVTILLLSFICMTSFPFLNSKPVWTVPKFYSSLSSKAIMDLIEVIHDCVAPCVAASASATTLRTPTTEIRST